MSETNILTREQIQALRERIRAATGPDRELDAAIVVATTRSGRSLHTAEPLTASIDACLALVERMLPGWHVSVMQRPDYWDAVVVHPHFKHRSDAGGPHQQWANDQKNKPPTAPLAILDAFLTALSRESRA